MNNPTQDIRATSTLVSASDVVMRFRSGEGWLTVLNEVSVDFHSGQLTLLVGPSGCGKTTLISILTGILTPTGGRIHLGGQDILAQPDDQRAIFRRKNIGFIFQQYNLLPHLTAAENAAVALLADGVSMDTALEKSGELLDQLGLADHREKYPRQLSGGQQQRVAIARALVHRPRFVVCDEPTAALDAESGRKVMEILKERSSSPDQAVIVVTHDDRVYHFADRIVGMIDGRIESDETRTEPKKETV